MDALKLPASSAALQSRTPPLMKAHTLGGGPARPVDGVSFTVFIGLTTMVALDGVIHWN